MALTVLVVHWVRFLQKLELTFLEELWISYNNIEKLKGIHVLKNLRVLCMSNNNVKVGPNKKKLLENYNHFRTGASFQNWLIYLYYKNSFSMAILWKKKWLPTGTTWKK